MSATVHVVARFLASSGNEEALKTALVAMVVPSRRELNCYQYDLLENASNPRELCIVERWDGEKALDAHLDTTHVIGTLSRIEGLLEGPPDIRRYRIV